MTVEAISKERFRNHLPDYTELVIVDLERARQKLAEVSIGSPAYHDYYQEALDNIERLREEGLDMTKIDTLMPAPLLDTMHIAA